MDDIPEFSRREKNKMAARKCRLNKDARIKALREQNEELEQENTKLVEEKEALEKKALEYKTVIKKHCQKGCQIPNEFLTFWYQEVASSTINECSLSAVTSQAAGIESNHTNNHEHVCAEEASPSIENTAAATGALMLFSGRPLEDHDVVRGRSTSISSKSSLSPPASSAQTTSQSNDKPKDLTHFLTSDRLPVALAPISTTVFKHREMLGSMAHIPANHVMSPAVSETNVIIIDPRDGNICTDIQTGQIPSENDAVKTNSEMCCSQNGISLGFSNVDGYSYPEDLQQMQTASVPHTNKLYQHGIQAMGHQKITASSLSSSQSSNKVIVPVSVLATALLDICPQMSQSFQQQIMTFNSSASSSMTDVFSESCLTQNSQRVNKENEGMHKGPYQEVSSAARKEATSNKRQQTVVTHSRDMMQRHSSSKPMKAVVLSPDQFVQTSQLQQSHQPQKFQRQMSGHIVQSASLSHKVNQRQQVQSASLTSHTEQMMPDQQGSQYFMLGPELINVSTTNTVIPGLPYKGTSSSMQTLGNSSPQPVLEHIQNYTVVSLSNSDGSIDSNGNIMPLQLVPEYDSRTQLQSDNEISHSHPQMITLDTASTSSITPAAQSVAPELDTYPDNFDFSQNIQDLPSLNLGDLTCDNNFLFFTAK